MAAQAMSWLRTEVLAHLRRTWAECAPDLLEGAGGEMTGEDVRAVVADLALGRLYPRRGTGHRASKPEVARWLMDAPKAERDSLLRLAFPSTSYSI